eukprot:6016644-Amphidinium_carterae.1
MQPAAAQPLTQSSRLRTPAPASMLTSAQRVGNLEGPAFLPQHALGKCCVTQLANHKAHA